MIDVNYYIQQAIFQFICVVIFVLQLLQLVADHYSPTRARLKRIFRRLGPLATLFIIARTIDPWAVYRIYNLGVIDILGNNATALLLCAFCAVLYHTIRSGYRILEREPPSYLKPAAILGACVFLVLANAVGILAFFASDSMYLLLSGLWLIYIALAIIVLTTIFNQAAFQLRHSLVSAEQDEMILGGGERENQIRQGVDRLYRLQLYGTALAALTVAVQLYLGIISILGKTQVYQPDPEHFTLDVNQSLLIAQIIFVILLLWHSWKPLAFHFAEASDWRPDLSTTGLLRTAVH